jgi:hypothetical protein
VLRIVGEVKMHEPFRNEFFWRIPVPFTDWTIWEGMIDKTLANLVAANLMLAVIIFAVFTWHHVSNRIDGERRKINET